MVGLSVHGLLGIDSELAQSAMAVRQQQTIEYRSVHVLHNGGDCQRAPEPKPNARI
jgi:hypothetical protein